MTPTELLLVLGPLVGGMAVGYLTRPDPRWYAALDRPAWTPPAWVYGPVWTALYASMGYAAWRVWRAGGRGLPMTLFLAQLALNFLWSALFFGVGDLRGAAVDSAALLATLVALVSAYSRYDGAAALLTLPYVAWVTVATALSISIARRNPGV